MRRFNELPLKEYAKLDIAEVNLECATGLPGSEELDIEACLAVLDDWAELIRNKTTLALPMFERNPQAFQNSSEYFRMLAMVTVLQCDLGVQYDLTSLEGPYDATDSRLNFIHGILFGDGGTCTSLPVLYVAIGRRLGYPLRLVQAVEHFFVRWDDARTGVEFNIEATSPGLVCHSNEYYKTWPKPMPAKLVEGGWMLKPMQPNEELALFYELRGRCFMDWMDFGNAMEMGCKASQLCMGINPLHRAFHAVATVLYVRDTGRVDYGIRTDTAEVGMLDYTVNRPMALEEPLAIRQAEVTLARIKSIHQARHARKVGCGVH